VCFVYITISAYYFVYHDPKNTEIKLIKSPEHEIKIIADDNENKDSGPRRAIYEDVFGDDKSNAVQNPNFPKEPILPSEEERQNAVLDKDKNLNGANNIKQDNAAQVITKEISPQNLERKPAISKERVQNSQNQIIQESVIVKKIKVQVGAFSSHEAANNYFNRLTSNYSSLLGNRKSYIKEVKISGKGIFYRLQIGDFTDQIAAEKFCQQFTSATKESKSDCILVE
jgi:hypothetical protein